MVRAWWLGGWVVGWLGGSSARRTPLSLCGEGAAKDPATPFRGHRLSLGFGLLLMLLGTPGCHAQGTGASRPAVDAPEFDGERAMQWLRRQVEIGPRVPGTETHREARRVLAAALGPGTREQEFTYLAPHTVVQMVNLIARFGPEESDRILLCAHWDTRPFADQDPDPANRSKPVPGANDGASGVAVLLEMARLFRAAPPPVGVTVVLFDGEDWGRTLETMFIGSRYFAEHPVGGPFRYGILLDMVGDADLQIYRERHSQDRAPAVVDRVWRAAEELGIEHFRPSVRHTIEDDHIPLLQRGIPVIDVIDFDYPYWHTVEDTPDKCSARSLKLVGDVVRRVAYTAARAPAGAGVP
ncbi:MAG: M28 family peptidase [Armatimonadetes bacterium]|nr:M28 family peptidase [Armatimonadota bacterium]